MHSKAWALQPLSSMIQTGVGTGEQVQLGLNSPCKCARACVRVCVCVCVCVCDFFVFIEPARQDQLGEHTQESEFPEFATGFSLRYQQMIAPP